MTKLDPLRGFRFLVEIEGLAAGAFTRVKGLSRELKTESFHEGGVNDYEHKLASHVAHPAVVLERGIALDLLWEWALAAARGEVTRRKVSVHLCDEVGEDAWVWHIDSAFPSKWSCSDLDALASPVAMESIELVHHGLRKGQ